MPMAVQQLESAIPTNAMGQMHDKVAGFQVEKTVDGPGVATGFPCLWSDLRPGEQLIVTQNNQSLGNQSETSTQSPPAQRHLAIQPIHSLCLRSGQLRQHRGQPILLGLVVTGHQHPLVRAECFLQLLQHPCPRTTETLDRLDRKVTGRFHAGSRQRRHHHAGKLRQSPQHLLDSHEILLTLQPLPHLLALAFQVGQLDQANPRPLGQRLDKQLTFQHLAGSRRLNQAQFDGLTHLQLPLCLGVKGADRIDLVAEKLQANRIIRVGSKQIDDAAMAAEFPGQSHRGGRFQAPGNQPFEQFFGVIFLAGHEASCCSSTLGTAGHRLHQRGNTGDHDRWIGRSLEC